MNGQRPKTPAPARAMPSSLLDPHDAGELIHCIYASAATAPLNRDELQALLARSRQSNAAAGLSGLLLYDDGSFFQVLEGPAGVVDALYARIEADLRHDHVTQIIREPIHRRAFGEWSMGFQDLNAHDVAGTVGATDFFLRPPSPTGVDDGRARKLIDAFRRGRWRRQAGVPAPSAAATAG